MAQEQQRLTPVERANLVAYLDGELNEAESQAIATKLSLSPTARREVEVLEKTWGLLDHLPRPKASEQFTERTLTEIRNIESAGGRRESAFFSTAGRLSTAALWLAAAAGAAGLGHLATNLFWPNPSARLARELSIAEHLDEYRDVGDFEFLKQLANSPEFAAEGGD